MNPVTSRNIRFVSHSDMGGLVESLTQMNRAHEWLGVRKDRGSKCGEGYRALTRSPQAPEKASSV